jgi:hypothetical protein
VFDMSVYPILVTLKLNWNLGDLASWLVAIGTVGTLIAALWQIGNERKSRREDERKASDAARRDQAQRVSAWYSGETEDHANSTLAILNASDEPVYQVIVTFVLIQGAGPHSGEDYSDLEMAAGRRSMFGTIPPGRWTTNVSTGWQGMYRRPGAELAFTDRAGVYWVRRADGALEELSEDPIDHFSIGRPVGWEAPQLHREA